MKVCLDAGHGGHDSGALWHGDREKDLTLAFILQLKALLRDKLPRVEVVTTRETDVFVSLADRCGKANGENCNVFISVHLNSSPKKDVDQPEPFGMEIWTYEGALVGEHLAERILSRVRVRLGGMPIRGVKKTRELYVLKHTKSPAVLIELGFINGLHDRVLLRDPEVRTRLATAVVEALEGL